MDKEKKKSRVEKRLEKLEFDMEVVRRLLIEITGIKPVFKGGLDEGNTDASNSNVSAKSGGRKS